MAAAREVNNNVTKETVKTVPGDGKYDIICVGFGPAALAIAIALRENRPILGNKKVLFLEKQSKFGWHTGMLLPGSKMQISFMKDLATMRNPQSHFTFTNYLHHKGRLSHFINLSTHTPFREEFNDYMKWCASHFNEWVQYNQEVLSVKGVAPGTQAIGVEQFVVATRDVLSGQKWNLSAKHVIVATGGEVAIPDSVKTSVRLTGEAQVIHSAQYMNTIDRKLPNKAASYRVAVIGGGQSAVEICEEVQARYPNASVSLIFRDSALRPSDDSPFVNEIFDPESVDEFFSLDSPSRKQFLIKNKATNYSVVRLHLIESLYEKLYAQKLLKPNPQDWSLFVVPNREVCGIDEVAREEASSDRPGKALYLRLKDMKTGQIRRTNDSYDLVVFATGYQRNPLNGILKDLKPLVESTPGDLVQRNYRLRFQPGAVRRDAGVWLQGSCEGTHGISDSLLSILAVRSGEIIDSIFGVEKPVEVRAKL